MSTSGDPASTPPALRSAWERSVLWQRLRRDRIAQVSLLILAMFAFIGITAPLISPHNPYDLTAFDVLDAEIPPQWEDGADSRFPLGTDGLGRDMLSTIFYGLRVSLIIGFFATILQATLGVTIGLVAGFFGGRLDNLLMRFADIQLSLSTLMVAIIVSAVVKQSVGSVFYNSYALYMLVLIIGISEWPQYARTVRASVLAEKKKDYVDAARILNFSNMRIMYRHVLPNTLSPIFVISTLQVANAIISEASLSFLGLGMPQTMPSLGSLIASGFEYIFSGSWWITFIPGIVLIVLVLVINLIGDWARDALNPRMDRTK